MPSPQGVVYLLHFQRAYKQARHRLGFAEGVKRRLELLAPAAAPASAT